MKKQKNKNQALVKAVDFHANAILMFAIPFMMSAIINEPVKRTVYMALWEGINILLLWIDTYFDEELKKLREWVDNK